MEIPIGSSITVIFKQAVKMGGHTFTFNKVYCDVKPDDYIDEFYQFYHSKYSSGYSKKEYFLDKIDKIY